MGGPDTLYVSSRVNVLTFPQDNFDVPYDPSILQVMVRHIDNQKMTTKSAVRVTVTVIDKYKWYRETLPVGRLLVPIKCRPLHLRVPCFGGRVTIILILLPALEDDGPGHTHCDR